MSYSTTPRRILFISHDGGMAGAQHTLLTLLQGINREMFLPYLVVPYKGELSERAFALKIPLFVKPLLHWLPCLTNIRSEERLRYLWRAITSIRARAWAIASLIEQHSIDIVYTNTATCIEGALAARMARKPHIWHIHEPVNNNSELLPLLPLWMYSNAIRFLSKLVIFPSHALEKEYPSLHDKAIVIHNGLKLPIKRKREVARTEIAEWLGIDKFKRWVAVVGAIQPRKDHSTFIRAARTILKDRNDVQFLIIGSGIESFTEALRHQITAMELDDYIIIAGRWPGPIEVVLSAIDVFVISSEQESFGLTAIEALAVETPVVSTRCGGPEEIIEDGKNGYLVPVKNADAMAIAISKLLGDPELSGAFGYSGRRLVEERFTDLSYVRGIEEAVLNAACVRG